MPESKVKNASPYPALSAALAQVPKASGVYLFKDAAGKVLYVGKAVNLRNRLGSYLKTPDRHDPKTALMLKRMARVDYLITAGGREALILERNLIKEHHPRYNVMLRDDKNYLCLRLDLKEDFPALRFVRRFSPDGALYFGPYTVAGLARDTLKVMKEVFRVRTCKERRLSPRSRPCLEFGALRRDGKRRRLRTGGARGDPVPQGQDPPAPEKAQNRHGAGRGASRF
jgi:excinuclease ABC subunit C